MAGRLGYAIASATATIISTANAPAAASPSGHAIALHNSRAQGGKAAPKRLLDPVSAGPAASRSGELMSLPW